MGSNRWIEAKIWQFVYLGYDWHTKQCRRTNMQPKQARPKPFTTHESTREAHTDEEWWRDGVKQTNWSRDMAVCVFGVLWHTTQYRRTKMQPKRAHSKPFTTHQNTLQRIKILTRIIQMRNGEEMGSNGWIEAEMWQFVYLGYNWHTKQCRRTKIKPK